MAHESLPATLRTAVAHDLRPVRPLRSPVRRALALLPLGLALLVFVPLLWGYRSNFALLGAGAAWGLSAVQSLAGLLVVGLALREAVPGRELSPLAIAAVAAATAALFLGMTWLTAAIAPSSEPPGTFARYVWECFYMAGSTSLAPLAAAGWLAARALPTRPAVAGAIYGLGAGLMNDAGVRLFCHVSSPLHVVFAHGGTIVCLTLLGAGAAIAIDRFRGHG
jgi:hypothetical protein